MCQGFRGINAHRSVYSECRMSNLSVIILTMNREAEFGWSWCSTENGISAYFKESCQSGYCTLTQFGYSVTFEKQRYTRAVSVHVAVSDLSLLQKGPKPRGYKYFAIEFWIRGPFPRGKIGSHVWEASLVKKDPTFLLCSSNIFPLWSSKRSRLQSIREPAWHTGGFPVHEAVFDLSFCARNDATSWKMPKNTRFWNFDAWHSPALRQKLSRPESFAA